MIRFMQFGKRATSKLCSYLVFSIFFALVLEITVFNLSFYTNLDNKQSSPSDVIYSTSLKCNNSTCEVVQQENQSVDIVLKEPTNIKNINIAFDPLHNGYERFELYVKDSSSPQEFQYISTPGVAYSILRTQFINIHATGKVYAFRLIFNKDITEKIDIKYINLNAKIPFVFSWTRVFLIFILMSFILCLRPKSVLYKCRFTLESDSQRLFMFVFFLCLSIMFIGLTQIAGLGRFFKNTELLTGESFINDFDQYNHYANSILNGHLYLDISVPDWLKNMKDPYDTLLRQKLAKNSGQPSYWDYAYFQGKYYSYFGVVPVLLAYIPFKLITGLDLRTDFCIAFFSVLLLLIIFVFVYQLLKTYTDSFSVGMYVLSVLIFIVLCNLHGLAFDARFYSLPILLSLFFTISALTIWISLKNNRKNMSLKLIAASTLIGLNLGCRPIFILSIFLAIPIFWNEIFIERLFFSKKGILNTISVIFPILFFGILIMFYNYVRFKSFFDFGISYNLTVSNMNIRSFSLEKLIWSIFLYFLQPYNINLTFPYIHEVTSPSLYNGIFILDPYYAGILGLMPTCICLFSYSSLRKKIKLYRANYIVCFCLPLAILIASVDGLLGAVVSRYISDFGWLIAICVVIVFTLLTYDAKNDRYSKLLIWITIIFTILAFWNLLSVNRDSNLFLHRPYVYFFFESLFSNLS